MGAGRRVLALLPVPTGVPELTSQVYLLDGPLTAVGSGGSGWCYQQSRVMIPEYRG